MLDAIPRQWIESITEVRLSNSLNMCSPWAFLSRYDGSLTIYSRRGTPEQALIAVLSELGAHNLGINTRNRHRRSKAEVNRIRLLIQPYVDALLPELPPPQRRLVSVPNSSFRPVNLNNGNF